MSINGGGHDRAAERVARNDALFREANERIRSAAESMELDHSKRCRCCGVADETCTAVLELSHDDTRQYARTRRTSSTRADMRPTAAVGCAPGRFDRYTVVEKLGEAAEDRR